MSDLNKKYQELLDMLKSYIKDEKELNLMKSKLSELVICFIDLISKVAEMDNNLIKLNKDMKKIQRRIDTIEEDIYIESDEDLDENEDFESNQMIDYDYEFEITCPYCDYEFITDNSYKNEHSIKCPRCKKIIELDWNIEEPCYGDCNSCSSHCYENKEEEEHQHESVAENDTKYSVDIKPPIEEKDDSSKNEKKNNEEDNNEDDM